MFSKLWTHLIRCGAIHIVSQNLFNIDAGNGLLAPETTKPLPEPVLNIINQIF